MNVRYIAAIVFLCLGMTVKAQNFYHLNASQLQIDSVLPTCRFAIPLEGNYADSVYTVDLLFPEFVPLSMSEVQRFKDVCPNSVQPEMPDVVANVVVTRKKGSLEASFCPVVCRDGRLCKLTSFLPRLVSTPVAGEPSVRRILKRTPASGRYAEHSVLSSGRWAKIRVAETGIYQLTDALIRQAGFTSLDKVKIYGYGGNLLSEKLTEADIIAHDDLKEVPTTIIGGRRLFRAEGTVNWATDTTAIRTRNPYSDYAYYFITQNDAEPLMVDSATFVGSFYPSPDDYHFLHEVDNYAWFQGGRNLYESVAIERGKSRNYMISYPKDAKTLTITVRVTANTATEIEVKDKLSDSVEKLFVSLSDNDKAEDATCTFVRTNNGSSADTLTVTVKSGGPARLDFISICTDVPRALPELRSSDIPVPEYVYNITNQDHHADGPVDMVIIIPTTQKLLAQAQRLADFHTQHDGLRVRIVPSDELINEFSGGTPDASAYRRYMKMLYDRAENEDDLPSYLLLFGDCAWDNRMNSSDWSTASPDDYLLCFESENSFSETACYVDDGFFCLLDDGEGLDPLSRDKLDVAVGRFPVSTEAEAQAMVDKTIAYVENENAGAWQNILVFMGDDGNNNIHMRDVNDAADEIALLYPGYAIKKIMWDAYKRESTSTGFRYPEVNELIQYYQRSGALIMDYGGHGRADYISHENTFNIGNFESINNTNLPLWITASCDIMPFDGSIKTLGEVAVTKKRGGAVAFFGTTRTVFTNYNSVINKAFLRHVLSCEDGKPITIGEAQRRAKNDMITSGQDRTENKLQYSLLGDPAISLCLPTAEVVVDSINGFAVDKTSFSDIQLKAGSIANVVGHIKDNETFDGVISATVFDTREQIVCRQNDPSKGNAPTAFKFYDRRNTLYSGNDSVRAGRFALSFAVSQDINYADAAGMMTFHAVNSDHKILAHGENANFVVGGSVDVSNDGIGPSIYCYLNSPTFTNGGDVNSTPYFVAEINDKDGINATGSGIGHDLQLIIDGDITRTYTLNDNFRYDFGTYMSGSTYYNIPQLEPGMHKLQFRAWDILSNSSTTELTFNVVEGLEPCLFSVSCTRNPATTSTTFIINHDRTGSNLDVQLDIFDMSGRLLWRHEESGVSPSSAYTVDWDLTVDGGQRLHTGVYLYRVSVSSEGGSKASKAQKLIIL